MPEHRRAVPPFEESAALIVGGTSGAGLATALQLARKGVPRIALAGRNSERGEKARRAVLAAAPKTKVVFLQGDANVVTQASRIVEKAREELAAVDILVNCTADIGGYEPSPLETIPAERIQEVLLSITMAPLLMSRLVLPHMQERGSGVIVNVASDAAKVPTPGETLIGAAMAAITVFSRTLAMEAKRFGVRVNAVTPSLIQGTTTAHHVQASEFSSKLFAQIEKMAALGVCGPDDIAAMIVYLVSPEAARVTGQVVSVNGGISAG